MKDRVKYIDFLKVIAIISVIAMHVNTNIRDYYIASNKLLYFIFTLIDSFPRAAVPLFLMITGYLMLDSNKEEKYSDFLRKKVLKLLIPFICISFIYFCEVIYNGNLKHPLFDFFKAFSNNEVYYHLWYMYSIIILYLFIPFERILVKNLKKEDLRNLILLVLIMGNLFTTIKLFSIRYNNTMLIGFTLPDLIIYNNYMLIGYYIKKYDIKTKVIYLLGILSLILMPIGDYFIIYDTLRNDPFLSALCILPALYGIGLFMLVKNYYKPIKIKLINKFICNCSKLSLYIYLIHMIFIRLFKKVIEMKWLHESFIENILFSILMIIITLIASYLVSKILYFIFKKLLKFTE